MSADSTGQGPEDPLVAGRHALARGAWDEARAWFEAARQTEQSPEALEGIGMAAWWRDEASATLAAREQAYRLFRQRGDRRGAARMAIYLAYDYYSFRGEYAVANGWFRRAHRLLSGLDPGFEQGLLAIYEGYFALMLHHDTETAQTLGAQAARIGNTLELPDIEMLALALEGLARVTAGDIAGGMRCLDEATTAALSGEMSDPDACCTACCYLIYACERVRDYERAAQWCAYMKEITTRWQYPLMFSYCRVHYAGVLIWRGDWAEGETMLLEATGDLVATRPAEAAEGIVRLADLRRRQGRPAESAALLARAESHPYRLLGGNPALLGRAALALDQGNPEAAVDLARRFLRHVPNEECTERPLALELLVLAHVASGQAAEAQAALDQLNSLAGTVATEALRAAGSFGEGIVTASRGEHETACRHLEDAVDLYKRNGAPFETARARIELARSLLALKRNEAAGQQADKALEALRTLGARAEAARAQHLLQEIAISQSRGRKIPGAVDFTPREREVLRLLAAGSSNQEIARQLVLSVRTVERHISNIYEKIGAGGPTARASATAYAHRHGFAQSHPARATSP